MRASVSILTPEVQILSWETLGDLVCFPQLRQPFYRVAGRNFLIQGLAGQDHLRIGFLQGSLHTDSTSMERFLRLCEDE